MEEESNEVIDSVLQQLVDILDFNIDKGQKPKTVFKNVQTYLAHDLESFIYAFIYDQVEEKNSTIASELLRDFQVYIGENLWFDFLRIQLLQGVPTPDATAMMARFLEKLKEKPNIELYFELLRYLVEIGYTKLFATTYQYCLNLIKEEKQFVEMLDILFEYFSLHDLDTEEQIIKELISERKEIPFCKKISPHDKQKLVHLTSQMR